MTTLPVTTRVAVPVVGEFNSSEPPVMRIVPVVTKPPATWATSSVPLSVHPLDVYRMTVPVVGVERLRVPPVMTIPPVPVGTVGVGDV
ncbi:MAG: hypothetical protein L0216_11200 [Planctomycetales bacterium]|nr:hypothetical protein [Planctomycetales bacterium]